MAAGRTTGLATGGRANTPASGSPLLGFVHRRRRGAELFLLVLSLVIGVGGYAAVGLGVDGTVPADIIGYGGWLTALIVAAHIVIRLVAPYADPVLLPLVATLNGLGLAVIHRLDLAYAARGRDTDFAPTQLVWMTLGVLLFVATLVIVRDHRVLARFTYTLGLSAITLLLLPMMPLIGVNRNGARIWINIGSLSFQPGEVAKVLLVLAFAGYLVLHRDALALAGRRVLVVDLPRGRDLGPILAMWLMSLVVLVFQRDLGSSLLFFGLFLVMLYVATERPGWIVVGATLFFAGAIAAWQTLGHVQSRVDIWLHPMRYYRNDVPPFSDQIVEAQFGMGWGGLLGRGFGEGDPTRVTYAESDFIMAAIGEELGLTAVLAVLLCYGLIVERALRVALISRDNFGKLVAVGLASVFALQVFVVIGGVTRLIPLTGLTTPFLSYGGSSLVANWVIIAILLRISDQARRPLPALSTDTEDADGETTQVIKL
ncbi:FtsW/RodA/SpoVE family cell cycle protein [Nocardioides sp. R-C-SC26]|uniref:FtsW/RodA/SpoVE family cell cycle protein n=1 Tax=Nocardioides sp. R-C-SC26 TaxID=2870414 RepID=UPI001E55DDFA|nr:FtsW/RodA/SpoVE family cell cycle protein [Nocardioides sp. R-C-SC26]